MKQLGFHLELSVSQTIFIDILIDKNLTKNVWGTITCRHIIYFITNAIILVIDKNPNKQHDIDQIEATERRGPDQANQASQWKYLSTHMEHLLN